MIVFIRNLFTFILDAYKGSAKVVVSKDCLHYLNSLLRLTKVSALITTTF